MSNQNQTQTANVQAQKQAAQPQVDMVAVIARQQELIEGLASDRDALFKAGQDLASLVKQMRDELTEVRAELKEEKIRQQLQAEAEAKALALVESFKTAVEAGGGVPGLPATANGANNGSYDRLHYLFKFGDKRRRGIF